MAAKCEQERVVSALKSLSSDGLSLPIEDRQNFEALIEEYFDDSGDDTGSEDEQVNFLQKSRHSSVYFPPELLGG